MDTIDLSNLNRQFLFREKDIGQPKAETAVRAVSNKIPDLNLKFHYCAVQDLPNSFYKNFNAVIAGLDSIEARRYINAVVHSLVEYDADGNVDETSQIPLLDGGTEGFKGHVRIVIPGDPDIACLDCNLDLYPPQVTYPMCTLANTPRLPEHCIEYAKVVLWPKSNPFGPETKIDTDNTSHINWLFQQAKSRADTFKISGVTFRKTLGVVKNIIPAVSSTNAIIAASCVNEMFKLITFSLRSMKDEDPQAEFSLGSTSFFIFNQHEKVFSYKFPPEKNPECLICGKNASSKLAKIKLNFAEILEAKKREIMGDSEAKSPELQVTIADLIARLKEKFMLGKLSLSYESGVIIFAHKTSDASILEQNLLETFAGQTEFKILVTSPSLASSFKVAVSLETEI